MFEPKGSLEERMDKLEKDSEKLQDYARRFREAAQEESVDRIEDFVNLAPVTLDIGTGAIETTSKARAYLSSDQNNISDTTATKVLLDAETYDPGENFDIATNNEYVARVSGYYFIHGVIQWTNVVASKVYRTYIYINGSNKAMGLMRITEVALFSTAATDILYVAADETIDMRAYHNAGAATPDIYGAESRTYLTIHLLSI